jgi:GTP-binding protein
MHKSAVPKKVTKATKSASKLSIKTPKRALRTQALKKPTPKQSTTAPVNRVVTQTKRNLEDRLLSSQGVDDSKINSKFFRNIAVIAHVDHGKTTLVDTLLKIGGTKLGDGEVCLMDSNQLERERGITILAKCTSVLYDNKKDGQTYQINLVDTPGHADFGGEVERIMSMVDGVFLVVDASDGPMTQTKFVLKKALLRGIKPIVVINKIDRPSARLGEVENEIFDMFVNLEASDEQIEYPVLYASGRSGYANLDSTKRDGDMHPLLEAVCSHIKPPQCDETKPFSLLVTQIESDAFFGKCLIGQVKSGIARPGDSVKALDEKGNVIENTKILKILRRRGMNRFVIDEAHAGDIVSIAGFNTATVNSTLCALENTQVIPSIPIDPPTISMTFQVNDSPLAGSEGQTHTANSLRARLQREAENNVSIRLLEGPSKEATIVQARGELQLSIIIETIRREGYELAVSPPQVVFDLDEKGDLVEPVEEITIDCEEGHSGAVIEKLAKRGADMKEFNSAGVGRVKLVFQIPSRGFIGFRSEFMNDTRGQGIINSLFHSYIPFHGLIERSDKGALVATEEGICTAYALETAQNRGMLFVEPQMKVYPGMIVGENSRGEDIDINVVKLKQLTNVRSVMKEDKTKLTPPKLMSLEEYISYIKDDQMLEVTPKSLRLRKKYLDPTARKQAARNAHLSVLSSIQSDPKFADYIKKKQIRF